MMEIKPIRSEADYQAALEEVSSLMSAEMGTVEGDRLDILATLVEAYESRNYKLDFPSPLAAIEFAMEQKGLSPKDLQPMIGRLNRVYEILNGTRQLTLPMIRSLHQHLGIPAEALIRKSPEK